MNAATKARERKNHRFVPDRALRFATGRTSVGSILVAVSRDRVVAVLVQESDDASFLVAALDRRFPRAELREDANLPALQSVLAFVEKPEENLALPMDIPGTPFQRRVWREIRKIPFGTTTTFAAIAARVGSPRAIRAVGNACARNPLEFAIPCHRVLRSDGAWAGGSAWGDRRQSTLVLREAEAVATRPRSRGVPKEKNSEERNHPR